MVSIHASAWEATLIDGKDVNIDTFQSTPPRGRRHDTDHKAEQDAKVSIHASAWEATTAAQAAGWA